MKQTVAWNWRLTHGYILFSFLLWLIFYSLNSASNTSETIVTGAILWKNDRWWMRRTFFINHFPLQCFYFIFCKIVREKYNTLSGTDKKICKQRNYLTPGSCILPTSPQNTHKKKLSEAWNGVSSWLLANLLLLLSQFHHRYGLQPFQC